MLTVPEEGLKKLQAAKAYILEEPRRLNMSLVVAKDDLVCGTTCCIAGALLLLDGQEAWGGSNLLWFHRAMQLLGLSEGTGCPLFFNHTWPAEYAADYNEVADRTVYPDEVIARTYGEGKEAEIKKFYSGVASVTEVAAARIHNAQVMARLIDEVCEKGGFWWYTPPVAPTPMSMVVG